MKKCFALHYGECTILNIKQCEKCNFYKTPEQLKREKTKAKRRISKLDKALQSYISEKYYHRKSGV